MAGGYPPFRFRPQVDTTKYYAIGIETLGVERQKGFQMDNTF